MKKVLGVWSLAILAAMCMGFSSCSKDSLGDISIKIIGKWQFVESSFGDFQPCDFQNWIEFKANGTLESYNACNETTNAGIWAAKVYTLAMIADGYPLEWRVRSITNEELILEAIPRIGFPGHVPPTTIYKFKKI